MARPCSAPNWTELTNQMETSTPTRHGTLLLTSKEYECRFIRYVVSTLGHSAILLVLFQVRLGNGNVSLRAFVRLTPAFSLEHDVLMLVRFQVCGKLQTRQMYKRVAIHIICFSKNAPHFAAEGSLLAQKIWCKCMWGRGIRHITSV